MHGDKQGFSLVELMVVIAIVAILSAIAMPSYRAYKGRVTVMKAVQFAEIIGNNIIEAYSRGAWDCANPPATFPVYGTNFTVNAGGFAALSGGPSYLDSMYIGTPSGLFSACNSTSGWIAFITLHINQLYTVPDRTDGRELTCGIGRSSSGIFQKICGTWDTGVNEWNIPIDLYPAGADCLFSTNTRISGGSCTTLFTVP